MTGRRGRNKSMMMLSNQAQQYIDKMRDMQCSGDIRGQDGDQFVSSISQNIALFFNKLIHSINTVKGNHYHPLNREVETTEKEASPLKPAVKSDSAGDNLESNASSTDRKESHDDNLDAEEMKDLDEIYRIQEKKLDNLPKKPVSSFFMYYQDHSKDFTAQVGEVGGSRLAQIVANFWRELPIQVKQPYYDRANADKARYKEEIARYIQEHSSEIEDMKHLNRLKKHRKKLGRKNEKEGDEKEDEDSEQVNIKIKGISQRQMKAAERKNYSHRPKAPVSSFFIYYQEEARNIANKYNVNVGSKLARLASNLWKGMNKEEKKKYIQASKIERERYHQQMAQYKIDYPNQIESRRKKISNSMKRALKIGNQLQRQGNQNDENSEQLSNLSEDSSSNSQNSQSSNSYVSSEDQQEKKEEAPEQPKTSTKRERKEKEDPMPHKPKGPICSFFQFYHSNIQQFMKKEGEDNKDAGSEFVRRASIKWKTLTKEEKQVYHVMARVDRDRYQKEMSHFKETYPEEYELLQEFNKNKQLKNKRKKMAKMEELKDLELDDMVIQ